MPDTKTERNAAIVAALKADPYLTLQAVADQYGITRERVRQLWKRATGEHSARRRPLLKDHPKLCLVCGQLFLGRRLDHRRAAKHGPFSETYPMQENWKQLYEDGLSSVQIGRIYGVAPSNVITTLHRLGVKVRAKSRPGMIYVVDRYHHHR